MSEKTLLDTVLEVHCKLHPGHRDFTSVSADGKVVMFGHCNAGLRGEVHIYREIDNVLNHQILTAPTKIGNIAVISDNNQMVLLGSQQFGKTGRVYVYRPTTHAYQVYAPAEIITPNCKEGEFQSFGTSILLGDTNENILIYSDDEQSETGGRLIHAFMYSYSKRQWQPFATFKA